MHTQLSSQVAKGTVVPVAVVAEQGHVLNSLHFAFGEGCPGHAGIQPYA